MSLPLRALFSVSSEVRLFFTLDDVFRIENLGAIVDKRAFPYPLVAFNTTSLETYEYNAGAHNWVKRELYDDTDALF